MITTIVIVIIIIIIITVTILISIIIAIQAKVQLAERNAKLDTSIAVLQLVLGPECGAEGSDRVEDGQGE